MNIKNIIFDLGGVIINLDYDSTARAFIELGLTNFNELYSKKKQEHFFDDFEKGFLTAAAFRDEIRKHLPHATDEAIDRAWNAMLLDVPAKRMELLYDLKKNYRIFLLSNTNLIHIEAFSLIVEKAHGKDAFKKLFDGIYYSCHLNMRKPDEEIFEMVIRENHLDKCETIFIDDSIQHVAGAKKAGIEAFLLEKDDDIGQLLQRVLKEKIANR